MSDENPNPTPTPDSAPTPTPAQEREIEANRARKVYDAMWAQFNEDAAESWTSACSNLRRALCQNAGLLVPFYFNSKDHMEAVFKVKEQMKSAEGGDDGDDPVEAMASWIRGDRELSRIPLEAVRKQ